MGPRDFGPLRRLAASCFSESGIRGYYAGGIWGWVVMLLVLLGKIDVTGVLGCPKTLGGSGEAGGWLNLRVMARNAKDH
jgi:hypothetical protein